MKKFLSIFNILSFLLLSYIICKRLFIDDYYFDDERKIIESGFKFLTDPFVDIIFAYISVVILKELFERLDYGDGYLKGKGEITEEHNNTFPISYWYRNKAYSIYRFTYKKTDSIEGNLGGAYKVRAKITWEFTNFRWVITDVFVHP